jgi:peptidyl-prolyl cis-trans isomerase C
MKLLPVVALALSLTAWAQVPAAQPVKPDTVVARLNGKPVTAAELSQILQANPPEVQKNLLKDPNEFLLQMGLIQELAAGAEKEQLDQKTPTKEALDQLQLQFIAARKQILAQAQITSVVDSIPVTSDDQKKFYEANHDKYTQAKVKMLFVSFQSSPSPQTDPKAKKALTEAEAKAKIEKLLVDLRAGHADFVKLVKENSDDAESVARDGDFGQPIAASDKAIPAEISKAIFALKPGQISDPLRQKTGYYLFRLDELGTQPFEQVRDDIFMEIRTARFNDWHEKLKKSVTVKIENEDFFKAAAAAK